MVPLNIKITEHEATLTAAVVPYGVSMVTTLDFAFLVADAEGHELVLSPYEYTLTEDFFNKNHSKKDGEFISGQTGQTNYVDGERVPVSRPRKLSGRSKASLEAIPEGGFGTHKEGIAAAKADLKAREAKQKYGDKDPEFKRLAKAAQKAAALAVATERTTALTSTGAVAMTENQRTALFPSRNDTTKTTNPDGTLSIPGLDVHGNPISLGAKADKAAEDAWKKLGPEEQQYVENFIAAGKLAMSIDLKTGKVTNPEQAAASLKNSKWYTTAHAQAVAISERTGIPLEAIVASHVVLSAGRQWSGSKSGNAETALALANIAAHGIHIVPTQAALDLMKYRGGNRAKGNAMVGLTANHLVAGKSHDSQKLDSATLVELMYAMNATRGHSTFADWKKKTSNEEGKPGMKTSPEQLKTKSPFPFFTSKGTNQVKQSMALLRGEVTARQGIDGPKYSSFYSNIMHPESNYSSTNDVWHYRIMTGNLVMSSTLKGKTTKGTMAELTLTEKLPKGVKGKKKQAVDSAQGLMQANDGMFRDSTHITKSALRALQLTHPKLFGKMKPHEFQALIWVHYGGGLQSDEDRTDKWFGALKRMSEVGL